MYTDVGDGPVAEAEYHDWYDHEHGPARLTVPGLVGACRYEAVDDLTPRWLALYELDSPAVLDSAEYKAVVEGGSDRDKFIMSHLATLDRRIYFQLSEDGAAVRRAGAGDPGGGQLGVFGAVDDMTAWYEQEHIPMLLAVPGWRRIRRYRLIGSAPLGGPGAGFLSLHELAGPSVLEDPGYRAAVSTPWRDRIVSGALSRERRVLRFPQLFQLNLSHA